MRVSQPTEHAGSKLQVWLVLPVVVPPDREQRSIIAFLADETARLEQMTSEVNTAIERLEEYLTALITATVTGKIDVRESERDQLAPN